MDLLSQEIRHQIVRFILGHPAHLTPVAEVQYMTGNTRKAVADPLDRLVDENILAEYVHEPNESKRDLLSRIYGPSERGIAILDECGYLDGVSLRSSYV